MLKEERHRYIIERIGRDNRVYVTGLSEELNVSDDTLRRDLVELERLGLSDPLFLLPRESIVAFFIESRWASPCVSIYFISLQMPFAKGIIRPFNFST